MKELERKIGEIGEWLGAGSVNFFGRQWAGKDSHAEKLGGYYGVEKLSGGDILRGSELSEEVRAIMHRGELIPTDVYRKTVLPYLSQTAFFGKPLFLSAVGRMSGEEHAVVPTLEDAEHPLKVVPLLDITEEEAYRRLATLGSRGREDDTPEGLRKRLEEFEESTTLVLGAYDRMGLLVQVDAMQPKDVVFEGLVHALHDFAKAA